MLYNTLRQYEYIVGVADAGSLTQAAARLNISQPSLSVAITRVEQRLENLIFVRGKGASIEVTPFGHGFIASARELLELAVNMEQGQAASQAFVLGCFEDIAPWYLAPALMRLSTQLPDVTVQGSEGRFLDLACDLAEGRVDLAISYDLGFDGNFERRKIEDASPVAFLSTDHPLAKKPSVELGDLAQYPIILFNDHLSEGYMRSLFERVQLAPVVRQRAASLEMMRSLAAHGIGVGISYSCPPTDVSYDGKPLVTVPIRTPQATADISLIWSSLRAPDPHFDAVLKVLS
ncbi:LysR family transcriptional regulator [Sulfitobacter sp. SK012]|uniref:LysR family transcriptional regulator n=1 Tax=Sulfitobacter sp. SK012 TaxID=1389005 RepID=UPI000E0C258E|nr:LysR family transcriptional regulator [Sulfitobacter sp. SK012]AXI44744.1 LysR family transcriptional regulator [Sulfitobacter sp. SK012]